MLLLLAPYLIGLLLLVAIPAGVTFWLSLHDYDLLRAPVFSGLRNFEELSRDDIFGIALSNSLGFIALAVPLRLAAAVALALLLHRPMRGAGAYRSAVYLPTVVPDVAYALLWLWIFNPLYGPLNLVLGSLGVRPPDWLTDGDDARLAIVIMSLFTVGEGFLVAMATRQMIPQELYDLAEIEDAGPLTRLRRVTLPLMAPTLVLLLFRDTIFSLQSTFVPALVLTEGGPPPYSTTYLPLFIYENGFEYLRYGYAAAATLIMFGVTAFIVAIQYAVVRRWRASFPV